MERGEIFGFLGPSGAGKSTTQNVLIRLLDGYEGTVTILEHGDAVRATAELAPVILVAAAITMLGYGTLVTSSYPPLRSIGVVSIASTVALAAASVFVLPALLLTSRPIIKPSG